MREVDKKAFGARVARRREALNLSQGDLAKHVGMKQQGVDNIEHGVVARPRLMRELATALKTTERWLLWQEGPEVVSSNTPHSIYEVPVIPWDNAGKLADPKARIPTDDAWMLPIAGRLGNGEFFALEVVDDAMDRFSRPGSIIIVNKDDRELVADRRYVFCLRREPCLYRSWFPNPNRLEPASISGQHDAIFINRMKDLTVIGRVYLSVLDLRGPRD
jgi:transcriptional regulator with XRE-family HTH domain